MSRIRKLTNCWLVVSLVLVGLGKAESVVLCIGQDGHVALENTETGICNHTLEEIAERTHMSVTSDKVQAEATCCPCSDMPLPGRSLDYERLPVTDILYAEASAEIDALTPPMFDECIGCPLSVGVIPRPPPPKHGCTAVWDALSSIVILA